MEKRQRRLLVAVSVCAELARQSWSRELLAVHLNIPMVVLDGMLAGTTAIDIDTLEEIAAALGVSADSLLGGDGR
ncbi:helix-turn-helix domain-containing protein [Cryobacterium soli]|uniref:helix-turn-helix domain-containing protein n=1 Tax=Cryobacterium soli TaxID=2220095 RepID=UPI000E74B637|nr:helix-turn-helix domain-containing protein [Cryobacterium soli]